MHIRKNYLHNVSQEQKKAIEIIVRRNARGGGEEEYSQWVSLGNH